MRVKLFTFRYSATLGGFDDSPLTEFLRDKEVLAFREHFFTIHDTPHLTCVVSWQDAVVGEEELRLAKEMHEPPDDDRPQGPIRASSKPRRARSRRTPPDPTAGLDERERVLFNTLREWRLAKAREEGVPPFLVFTNRHFLEIVRKRPESPTALGHVSGIGPGKVERYGGEVLAILNGTPAPAPEAAPAEAATGSEGPAT